MKSRLSAVMIAVAAVFVVFALAVTPSMAQTAEYEAPRAWDGHPDLNGIWQAIGTAHWNLQDHPAGPGAADIGAIGAVPPGQGVVEGDEIPYQPWALEQKPVSYTHLTLPTNAPV